MNIFDSVLLTDDERKVIFSVAERLSLLDDRCEKAGTEKNAEEFVWMKESDFKKLKEEAIAGLLTIYAAAAHFVNVSRVASDIAKAVNTTPDGILRIAQMREWEVAVRRWGWTGDPMPEVYTDNSVPYTLREAFLLQKVFQKYASVRLVTYDGFVDTHIKGVFKYDLLLADSRRIKKHDVILAFPKGSMLSVKKVIKVRKRVADLGLTPIVRRSERLSIDVDVRIGADIECVMRNGLVVRGENIWLSKYNIVMRVGGPKGRGGKVILVYRHALHDFKVLKPPPVPESSFRDDFDEEEEFEADDTATR